MQQEGCDVAMIHSEPSFVVVSKPGGLLSVPGRGPDKQDCVANRIKAMFPGCLDQPAVHRLDMATSGIMVLALNRDAHRCLSGQFERRLVKKRYIALLEGNVAAKSGCIRLSFRLDPDHRPYQVYDPVHGKPGMTFWRCLDACTGGTRVEFTPFTGRTHQLRLHAAHPLGLGCPIIGDQLYGRGRPGEAMLLHAAVLAFHHPFTGVWMQFHSAPPF